jgi:anaerobic sulfite reductase subunit B
MVEARSATPLARDPTAASEDAFVPRLHRVVDRRPITEDVVTLTVEPLEGPPIGFRAGQFNMLTAFGVGEVPVSMSNPPGAELLEHTIRDVGPVTHALCQLPVGGLLGVRGAFGTDWGVEELAASKRDVVVVAGGIGLAPLRGAVVQLLSRASGDGDSSGGRVTVLVGARTPGQVVFEEDLSRWQHQGAQVELAVDVAEPGWTGHVGVVTTLVALCGFDLHRAAALVCGPEIMMRFVARELLDHGMAAERISVSLERNMQCGIGLCGHCQLGPLLLCRDGPVLPYGGVVAGLLAEKER